MPALLIGAEERQKIAELRAFAAANVQDAKHVMDTTREPAAEAAHRDMMDMHSIELPVGYHVTYSHERQPPGLCVHISISVDRPNKMPHPAAVETILEAFGMQPIKGSPGIWIEDINAVTKALNIVQLAT